VGGFGSDGARPWARTFSGSGVHGVTAVTVDSAGNIIVVGGFEGSLDAGSGELVSTGGEDVFVVELDRVGRPLWSRRFGDAAWQYANAVTTDAEGNVLVAGRLEGSADFGGGSLSSTGSADAFLVKLGPGGEHLWSRRFGEGRFDVQEALSVAADASGRVAMTGIFDGLLSLGAPTLSSQGAGDAFIALLSPSGDPMWSKRLGDAGFQMGTSVTFDVAGNLVATGLFQGSVDFGQGKATSAGGFDIYLASFDIGGNLRYERTFGGAGAEVSVGVAPRPGGGVVVVGRYMGSFDMGLGALPHADSLATFVAAFDPAGHPIFSRGFVGGEQIVSSVAVGRNGDIVIAGSFQGAPDFGAGPKPSAGATDFFVLRLDQGGALLDDRRFGDADFQDRIYATMRDDGAMILAGRLSGSMDIGAAKEVTGSAEGRGFVLRFPPR